MTDIANNPSEFHERLTNLEERQTLLTLCERQAVRIVKLERDLDASLSVGDQLAAHVEVLMKRNEELEKDCNEFANMARNAKNNRP